MTIEERLQRIERLNFWTGEMFKAHIETVAALIRSDWEAHEKACEQFKLAESRFDEEK